MTLAMTLATWENSASAETRSYNCLMANTNKPLSFRITEEESSEDFRAKVHASVSVPENLNYVGFSDGFSGSNPQLELMEPEPLRLLGLAEWDLDEVKFYNVSDAEDDIDAKLSVTSIKTRNKTGELKFSGAYGNFMEESFLCSK